MDQIDFMGPFEVLSRMPDTMVQIIGKEVTPIRDVMRLLRRSNSPSSAPNPVFDSGTPESAPAEVLQRSQKKYEPIGREREAEAILHAERNK